MTLKELSEASETDLAIKYLGHWRKVTDSLLASFGDDRVISFVYDSGYEMILVRLFESLEC